MRIAIPVEEQKLESAVCPSFGRAPYFLFFSTVTGEHYFLDNSAVVSQGGAGIRAAQLIADHGANVLLTPRCGENAEEVLRRAEVLVYRTGPGTARENIEAMTAERLLPLQQFHPGFHGHAN